MLFDRQKIILIIGAVAAVLLQQVIVPAISIGYAMPNLILVYVVLVGILLPGQVGLVLPFVMGLIYDCTGTGPLGVTSALFLLVTFITAQVFSLLDNSSPIMTLFVFLLSIVIVEMAYCLILIFLGLPVGIFDAFLYRTIPCSLYDCVLGLILFPLLARILQSSSEERVPPTPQLR